MFGLMLFLHLTGLFLWLGATLALVVTLTLLKKQLDSPGSHTLAKRIIRAFSLFAHPGAVIVLLSGVYMIVQMGMGTDKPLWLEVMEKGGGTIVILALVLTGILGGKVKKRLNGAAGQDVKLSGFVSAMSVVMVLIVSVVLIVSLKI